MKMLFTLSVLFNLILIFAIGCYAFYKRDKIPETIQKISGCYQSPREDALANFNNEPLEAVNDSLMIGADSTITCLFLGNSLTYCGVPEEEQDKEKRGLTSTSKDRDYVHVLIKKIAESKHMNVNYSILNISQFERTFTEHSFSMEKLQFATNKQPDYLFVQIGENVAKEDIVNPEKYEIEYAKLLSFFPNSKKIITIPFWPDKNKEYATTRIAVKSNSFLVDLSHLGDGTDANNFSSSFRKYKMPGVGSHPGDYGMVNIAECIYATFNALETISTDE